MFQIYVNMKHVRLYNQKLEELKTIVKRKLASLQKVSIKTHLNISTSLVYKSFILFCLRSF